MERWTAIYHNAGGRRSLRSIGIALMAVTAAAPLQRDAGGFSPSDFTYDGRVTFARLRTITLVSPRAHDKFVR